MVKAPEPDPNQGELFPEEAIERKPIEPTKSPRSEGLASCPAHTGKKETGLIVIGQHLVWRQHNMTTHGGTATECRTSLVPICQTGAKPRKSTMWRDKNGKPAVCPHDRQRPKGY
jgi:hypothetical protein